MSYIKLEKALNGLKTLERSNDIHNIFRELSRIVGDQSIFDQLRYLSVLAAKINKLLPSCLVELFRALAQLLDIKDPQKVEPYTLYIIQPRIEEIKTLLNQVIEYNALLQELYESFSRASLVSIKAETPEFLRVTRKLVDSVSVEISAVGVVVAMVKLIYDVIEMKQKKEKEELINETYENGLSYIEKICTKAQLKEEEEVIEKIKSDLNKLQSKAVVGQFAFDLAPMHHIVSKIITQILEFSDICGYPLKFSIDDMITVQRLKSLPDYQSVSIKMPTLLYDEFQRFTRDQVRDFLKIHSINDNAIQLLFDQDFTGKSLCFAKSEHLLAIGVKMGTALEILSIVPQSCAF